MNPTQCLREEHQVILRVLDCFEVALRSSRETGQVQREVFEPFIEFFRGFADKCHHCKEEDRLFPVLERNGIPRDGGPIGVMLEEHRQGRTHVAALADHLQAADGGDRVASRIILEHGSAYVDLLRQHIDKEDHCLFEMAVQVVQGADLAALAQAYREAENAPDYPPRIARCRTLAEQLAQRYDVPMPQTP